MNFETAAQKAVYEKISPWMKDIFGEQAMFRNDVPGFAIMAGSAFAQVFVFSWGSDDATVSVIAYVVTGADLTPTLMRYLLQENHTMRFGAFSIDKDGDIVFEHTIVGSTCDKAELKASIFAVARTADDYDDQIIARFGGKRAVDNMR